MLQAVFTEGINEITVLGLKQWSKGKEIQITLSSLPSNFEVHFSYKRSNIAYVVAATATNGIATVSIPNIVTVQPTDVIAYIYVENASGDKGDTIATIHLPMWRRERPSDYIYEDQKLPDYRTIEIRLDEHDNVINQMSLDISNITTESKQVANEVSQLSSEIENLEPNNLNLIRTNIQPANLINKYKLIPNHYVDTEGIVRESEVFYLTDYIEVTPLSTLYSHNAGLTCFYDSSKNFISYHMNFADGVEVPSNAMYIRASIPTANIDIAIISYDFIGGINDNGMIVLSKNKAYEPNWIRFTVPVNQSIVSTNDTLDTLLDSQNYVDVECVLQLPTSYTPYGTPTKLLMLCHGAGRGVTFPASDGNAWVDVADYNALVANFVANGYAVFDCNGYDNTATGCSFWGAPKGVEAWKKAYDYVVNNYNVETSFSLFGFSMGGLTACHLVMNGFPNIKCVGLASPVLDLEKCWEDGQTTLMELGYGMSGAYDESKALGSNPMSHLVTIGDKEYCLPKMPPIKIWYGSTEEGIAVNKNYAIRLVNAMKNSGNYAVYREYQGGGHEICYGGNSICNIEFYLWINRFNANYFN